MRQTKDRLQRVTVVAFPKLEYPHFLDNHLNKLGYGGEHALVWIQREMKYHI